jgi:glycosyltransferase involved in cell wall biosynthesis
VTGPGRPGGPGAHGRPGTVPAVHVVLPGGVDDPAAPSGGNRYDRAVCDRLARATAVHEIAVPGSWPRPGPAAVRALGAALAELPDGATVLLDGLVACGVPEVLEPHAGRLRAVVLLHLPLGDETGLAPADAADLAARERRVLHAAAGVVATSAAAARRITALHDLPADRITVAPPGVDPAPVAVPSDAGDRLLCVAAVTPRKGHDVLIGALAQLGDLAWSCVCVGALDRAGFLPAERPPGLTFAGPRTGAGLDAAYARADLLVLPSRAETYGMVVTEALARGIPVLATRVDGVPEALGAGPDGAEPGELVPPGDPDALAAALRRWLTDPELRRRRRAAALARRAGLRGWDDTAGLVAGALQEGTT